MEVEITHEDHLHRYEHYGSRCGVDVLGDCLQHQGRRRGVRCRHGCCVRCLINTSLVFSCWLITGPASKGGVCCFHQTAI